MPNVSFTHRKPYILRRPPIGLLAAASLEISERVLDFLAGRKAVDAKRFSIPAGVEARE